MISKVVGVIGTDGRTTAIIRRLEKSKRVRKVVRLSSGKIGSTRDSLQEARAQVIEAAREAKPEFVVIGPEEPLAADFVTLLRDELNIPAVGPTGALARLESSKAFARNLIAKHGIDGNPRFRVFEAIEGVEGYLRQLENFVIKPDGLTGGKGVRVSDIHIFSIDDALVYCTELFHSGQKQIVIEEKLDGEEFSLQSFCDGACVKHMPVVQDHKRIWIGDTGPNTGGMGSYSCSDHTLPFLTHEELDQAKSINVSVCRALREEIGEAYKGILYGGFMATRKGVRLIEYNVRFGDPEALNILSLLETDFAEICEAIINGTLGSVPMSFANLATVCKYVVPEGYPEDPARGKIDLSKVPPESETLKWFRAAVEEREDGTYLTSSRSIAFVGIASDIQDAEKLAEQAARAVGGPVYHRPDIGTRELIEARVDHMRRVRATDHSALVR